MNFLPTVEIETAVPTEQTEDADLNLRETQFNRLTEHLDYCRQQQKTVSYLEAADAIDVQAPRRIHQLTMLLETLMEYDQKHRQPIRAALVVSRDGAGLPAEGFFIKAQELGLMQAGAAQEFHQQCLNRLFSSPASASE